MTVFRERKKDIIICDMYFALERTICAISILAK